MKSRIPRYHQIAESLRQRIRDGELAPGERLDNQRRLAREFGVTLMTLRHALELLERDRLIARRHGLGTFVASPSVDYDILQFQRLAADLSAHGEDVDTRVLGSRFAVADRQAGEALGLRAPQRVFVLERLRLVGGHPMSFQASFLAAAIGEEVAKADLAVTPLHEALVYKLGIEIAGAHETVAAVALPGRAARELGCRPGTAAFRSDRVSTGPDGSPIVYDRVFIPGDRFRITRQLTYDRTPAGPAPGTREDSDPSPDAHTARRHR